MVRRRVHGSDIAFAVVLLVALPVAAFLVSQGRYGNAALAGGAFLVGVAVLFWSLAQAESPVTVPIAVPAPPRTRPPAEARRAASGRLVDWVPLAVLSGTLATSLVLAVLAVVYSFVAALGSPSLAGGRLSQWLAALVRYVLGHRTPGDLALALGLQLALGIGGAVLYAAVVEPALEGPNWRRGLLFAVVPGVGDVLVVLPLLGAGPLGLSLAAGPLPLLAALVTALLYGPTLGAIYGREDVLTESGEPEDVGERPALLRAEDAMAAALVPGMVLGGVIGLVGSTIVAPGQDGWMAAVVGAVCGGGFAMLLAPFLGLRAGKTPP